MKTSNFKKVLALVLALAMVLSVCTMSFSVSAETADLSYYVFNDGTIDGAWTNGSSQKTVALGNDAVLRIAPQRTGKSQVNVTLEKGDLTADDFATVNTLSYYVKNETDAPLTLRYQYYLGNGSSGYFNGYVYLVATDEAEIVPYKADKDGNITLPAKFEGYVVYDLSKSDNYGNVGLNLGEGNWDNSNTVVDYIKAQSFSNMVMFYTPTDDMLTKAFYLDDVAVSTKTVEELAKFLTGGEIVSYNFNNASKGSILADDSVFYWGKKFDNYDVSGNCFPTHVDYEDDMDGVGSKFTVETQAGGQTGTAYIRKSFLDAVGTGLAFDPKNAKGFKVDYKQTANVGFDLLFNGEGNSIQGTYYYVTKDGVVSTTKPTGAFDGTVYCIFSEGEDTNKTVKWQWGKAYYNWAECIDAKTLKGMALYTGEKGVVGSSITYGGFSFIYDTTDFATKVNNLADPNPIVVDGSVVSKRGANSTVGTYNGRYDLEYGDSYKFTLKSDATGTNDWFYMNNNCAKINVADPENVNALAFEAYLPKSGSTYNVQLLMSTWDMCYYRGAITAVDYDGTVYTAAAVSTGSNQIVLPSGFDGVIIMEVKNAVITTNYNDAAGTKTYTGFEAYYNAATFSGIQARISSKSDKTVPVSYVELDDLRLVYDTVDDYVAALQADHPCKEHAEAILAAEEEALLKGTHVVNTFTGEGGNTFKTATSSNNVVTTTNEWAMLSDDDAAGKLVFNAAAPTSGQRRVSMPTNIGDLDPAKMAGFTYRVEVLNDDGATFTNSFQIDAQQNGLNNADVYLIEDATGIITKASSTAKVTFNNSFVGTVVVLFNENTRVKATWGGSTYVGERTWPEFIANNLANNRAALADIGLWVGDAPITNKLDEAGNPVLNDEGKNVKVLTEAGASFEMYYDDLAIIYDQNPILDTIEDKLNTTKYAINPKVTNSTAFGGYSSFLNYTGRTGDYTAPFNPSIDANAGSPSGNAYKFTRVETELKNTRELNLRTNHTLTKDELKAKEALVYWVKVPEGESVQLSRCLNGESWVIRTSLMAYDTVKNELTTYADGKNLVLSGFEGYVILPLQYALIGKDSAMLDGKNVSGAVDFDTFVDAKGITNLYFYMAHGQYNSITTSFWMGDFRFVDSISAFMEEIGEEVLAGDVNNDKETDLRDIVRLKKFNADANTEIAYHNADVDGNGLIDTAADLVNARKQNVGVDYVAPEKDASLVEYPETMVGIFHAYYGAWNSQYADIIDESEIVNMYSTSDIYELAQLKENGGYAWFYLHEAFGEERVFEKWDETANEGKGAYVYDRESETINEDYKKALDNKVQQLKKLGLWNTVVGFTSEEILMGDQTTGMTQAQFRIWTQYLAEKYGKRFNACLSTYEVNGGTHTSKTGEKYVTTAANADTYAYVTDIGYDWYTGTLEQHKTMFNNLVTCTGNRSDVKYWFYPTAYSGDGVDDDVLSGTPTRTDDTCAEQIEIFAAMADVVPEGQLGGYYFYTWSNWSDSYGLESLIEDFDYTKTCDALIKLATKYVD